MARSTNPCGRKKMKIRYSIIGLITAALIPLISLTAGCGKQSVPEPRTQEDIDSKSHFRATYDPLHFKPAIASATNEQCLACHREVLEDRVRPVSPAGVKAQDTRAWYQQISTYKGEQDTFHRRHLVTPMAQELMNLQCNTCHEGHDPREEAPGSSATGATQDETGFTLRKQVNPETTCLKCHGQFPGWELMRLPGTWDETKHYFQNDCLTCHVSTRTHRHQVNYLKADAIEAAAITAKESGNGADVCLGCHGARAWYRIAYPYARNPWPEMPEGMPDWAKDRPVHSESRFIKTEQKP
ncbi:MAG: hypothetical protein KBF41_12480 [Azonexus sp.]|jgi:hypothetical protein|nr:hypothetical protein [Azonexus sp.]